MPCKSRAGGPTKLTRRGLSRITNLNRGMLPKLWAAPNHWARRRDRTSGSGVPGVGECRAAAPGADPGFGAETHPPEVGSVADREPEAHDERGERRLVRVAEADQHDRRHGGRDDRT